MHVYTNFDAEQPTQLTPEAIRCCQNLQVDYKELLPFPKDRQEMIGNDQQLKLVMRQYE